MENALKGTLKPLGDRVIVKPDEVENEGQTKSGLIIPDANKEKPLTGTVVAIGPGRRDDQGRYLAISEFIKVGARVYFGKFTGVEVKQEDSEVLILHEDEIYGVIE